MTALNFVLQEDQVCLALDTLSISAEDGCPLTFRTKFVVLPHLKMIVTGTGLSQFVESWMVFVNTSMVVRDIDHVDQYAPEMLSVLAKQCENLNKKTTTIYHFGFAENRKRYVAYAYRSTNDWQSEELKYGFGVKPQIDVQLPDIIQLPDTFIDIMKRQCDEDLKLELSKRIGVGGDIHFVQMKGGNTNVSVCYRFESYEKDYEQMCEKLKK